MNTERTAWSTPGIASFFVLLAAAIAVAAVIVWYAASVLAPVSRQRRARPSSGSSCSILVFGVVCIGFGGLTAVNPNEARALVLFGHYRGTVRDAGPPVGQPVHDAAQDLRPRSQLRDLRSSRSTTTTAIRSRSRRVVVWKVTDTAEALFEVDDYENFVHVQAESALRNLATTHPYDAHVEGDVALRSHQVEVADQLRTEIQDRLVEGRRPGDRGPDQPPRLRPGDRQRDAPPPAGERGHRGALPDRRGRGRDGRDGARAAVGEAGGASSTRSARPRW